MHLTRGTLLSRLFMASLAAMLSCSAVLAGDEAMRERLQACAACHSQSELLPKDETFYPSINAKPVEYLYQQLLNFRDGRRRNSTMNHMLAYLSSEYLHDIAEYYARQPAVSHAVSPAMEQRSRQIDHSPGSRGWKLVFQGDGNSPACAECHGNELAGDGIAIPGLRRLGATYISSQLGAWKAGTRHAREPDCMAKIAASLDGSDVEIVAQWVASAPDEAFVQALDLQKPSVSQPPDSPVTEAGSLPIPCGAVQ